MPLPLPCVCGLSCYDNSNIPYGNGRALYRAENYRGLVLCTIIHAELGEPAFGTSASKGVLRVTIRGELEEEMNLLERRIDALAYGLASESGLDYRTEFCDAFPETCNHEVK